MKISGKGPFEVQMQPLDTWFQASGGNKVMRMRLNKQYLGVLQAEGQGELLGAATNASDGQAYCAIEEVSGSLEGRDGSFMLQHFSGSDGEDDRFFLSVVKGSGTGDLQGLAGTVGIEVEDGQHFYILDLTLP